MEREREGGRENYIERKIKRYVEYFEIKTE